MDPKKKVDEYSLPVPDPAQSDPEAFELLRVWAAHGEQCVAIHSGLAGGPEGFGFMLAQLSPHAALLYAQRESMPPQEALKLIRQGFDDEWEEGTWPSGKFPPKIECGRGCPTRRCSCRSPSVGAARLPLAPAAERH
jgi:hypothetical protein